MRGPVCCNPEAHRLFESSVPLLDTTDGLFLGAVAIALHELDNVDPSDAASDIERLVGRIRDGVRSTSIDAILAHAHAVLFDEEGFRGNIEGYYEPRNSYVPAVLETKRGIPITLVLIYKCVLEKLGVLVSGVNAPGHFLAEVRGGESPMLIDAFAGGQALTETEARQRIAGITGLIVPDGRPTFSTATHRQWLGRMLQNLLYVFAQQERERDVKAMLELRALLEHNILGD